MSNIHLNDIRQSLEKAHWKVTKELDGDGYRISGVWVVERPDETNRFHLDFEGLDDIQTLPVEKSFGCTIREAPHVSCYFSRQGRSWPHELADFERKLDEWGKANLQIVRSMALAMKLILQQRQQRCQTYLSVNLSTNKPDTFFRLHVTGTL